MDVVVHPISRVTLFAGRKPSLETAPGLRRNITDPLLDLDSEPEHSVNNLSMRCSKLGFGRMAKCCPTIHVTVVKYTVRSARMDNHQSRTIDVVSYNLGGVRKDTDKSPGTLELHNYPSVSSILERNARSLERDDFQSKSFTTDDLIQQKHSHRDP